MITVIFKKLNFVLMDPFLFLFELKKFHVRDYLKAKKQQLLNRITHRKHKTKQCFIFASCKLQSLQQNTNQQLFLKLFIFLSLSCSHLYGPTSTTFILFSSLSSRSLFFCLYFFFFILSFPLFPIFRSFFYFSLSFFLFLCFLFVTDICAHACKGSSNSKTFLNLLLQVRDCDCFQPNILFLYLFYFQRPKQHKSNSFKRLSFFRHCKRFFFF
jgi:hypothetical protein